MSFPTRKGNTALQAQLNDFGPSALGVSLTPSKDTGDLVQRPPPNGSSIKEADAPVAKPWAHFVAGA